MENLGSWTSKYQRIRANRIPLFATNKENALLKMYFEGYHHESTDSIGLQFADQMRGIQNDCCSLLEVVIRSSITGSRRIIPPVLTASLYRSYSGFNEVAVSQAQSALNSSSEDIKFEPVQPEASTAGIINFDKTVMEYNRVLELLRTSDLLVSNPGFIDRIKDCEEDIQTYEATGELPTRIGGYIKMMKHALHIQ